MSDRCTIDAALILAMASALLPVPSEDAKPNRSGGVARNLWPYPVPAVSQARAQPAPRGLAYAHETPQPRAPSPHRRAA